VLLRAIGRSLLPNYNATLLFSEYVGYVGIAALMLALLAVWLDWRGGQTRKLAGLAILGGLLALGAYNPINWLLVDYIPGFDLFQRRLTQLLPAHDQRFFAVEWDRRIHAALCEFDGGVLICVDHYAAP